MNEPNEPNESNQADQAEAQALLQHLAESTALLPQDAASDGEPVPEGAISLPVIEQDGTQYVAVFTSEESLSAAGADPELAARLPLAELAAQWPSDELWMAVNPSSDGGLTLPPDVIRALPALAGVGGTGNAP